MPRVNSVLGKVFKSLHARLCPRLWKNVCLSVCLSPDHPQSRTVDLRAVRRKDMPMALCFVLL